MDLFGVGPVEVLVVLVIAVIIFGPEELPGIAVKVARFIRQARALTGDITGEFTKEIGSVIQLEEPTRPNHLPTTASPTTAGSLSQTIEKDGQPAAHHEATVSSSPLRQSDSQELAGVSGTARLDPGDEPGQAVPVGEEAKVSVTPGEEPGR